MTGGEGKIKKILFCGVVVAVFLKMFILSLSWDRDLLWEPKYRLFSVPAFSYPGADARNIQTAAHCARGGAPYYGSSECMKAGHPVRARYPQAEVPAYNYPSLWARGYALFADDSEHFFIQFWVANALLLLGGILLCCVRYNYLALPLFLFSPITLLTIERGNTDGALFFLACVPLLLGASSARLPAFFVGFATALKIFPVFGYLAFVRARAPFVSRDALLGALWAAPLIVMSVLEIPQILSGMTTGFENAYGLVSLGRAPYLRDHPSVAYAAMAGFVICLMACLFVLSKFEPARRSIEADLEALVPRDAAMLVLSVAIYLGTFFCFSNWAYRLVFLIPACLILSKSTNVASKLMCLNILVVFWSPIAPSGWVWQNLACFPLTILLSWLLVSLVRVEAGRGLETEGRFADFQLAPQSDPAQHGSTRG